MPGFRHTARDQSGAYSAGVGGRLMLAAPHDAGRCLVAHQIYVPAYTSSIGPRIRGRPRVASREGERGTYLRRRGRGAWMLVLLPCLKSRSKADLQAAHRPACRYLNSPRILRSTSTRSYVVLQPFEKAAGEGLTTVPLPPPTPPVRTLSLPLDPAAEAQEIHHSLPIAVDLARSEWDGNASLTAGFLRGC